MQNLKKNWLVVWINDMRNLANVYWKVSKFELWWDPFIESRKCMSLRFAEELCNMTIKNDPKFSRNWFVVSKLTPQFDEFWPEHSNVSNICTLKGSFWIKHIMFELNMYRRVMFDGTEDWCKIWKKTDLCFPK